MASRTHCSCFAQPSSCAPSGNCTVPRPKKVGPSPQHPAAIVDVEHLREARAEGIDQRRLRGSRRGWRTTSSRASSATPLPLQQNDPQDGQSYFSARSGKVKKLSIWRRPSRCRAARSSGQRFAAAAGAATGVAASTGGAWTAV